VLGDTPPAGAAGISNVAKPTKVMAPTGFASTTLPAIDCSWLRDRGSNPDTFSMAKPLRQDSRLVVFPYDKNAIYPINTYYNRFTHFEFEAGESVLGVYLNDETEWEHRVSATGTDLFIRPKQHAVSGSVTVITARRRYEMDLLDVQGCDLPRYQRVSWFISEGIYEDREAIAKTLNPGRGNVVRSANEPVSAVATNAAAPSMPSASPLMVNLQKLNSNYAIEGDQELAPEQVMDDGTRTWFKFKSTSRRPALFLVNPDGMAETIDYAVEGSYFVTARMFPHGILLKDGKSEVRIRNKASTCSWFDDKCKSVQVKNMVDGK
jgi:type IV secretion system protein VirB9